MIDDLNISREACLENLKDRELSGNIKSHVWKDFQIDFQVKALGLYYSSNGKINVFLKKDCRTNKTAMRLIRSLRLVKHK